MNTKKQIITLHLIRSIMILLMMGWTGGAWAQTTQYLGSVSFEYQTGTKVDGEEQKKDYQNMVPELEEAIISELPSAMKNVRSFTIPTNYTLFKSVNDDGTMNKNYYTLDHWAHKTDL